MMPGYDAADALQYVVGQIRKDFSQVPEEKLRSYIKNAIALDQAYIEESDAMGDGFYDDDDAFEIISERMAQERGASDEEAMLIAQIVDAYMDAHETYLEKNDLIGWDED